MQTFQLRMRGKTHLTIKVNLLKIFKFIYEMSDGFKHKKKLLPI